MKQLAVIGLGRFGFSVAETLAAKNSQVLAIDIEEEKVQDISEFVTHAVQIDATDEKALKAVGIKDVDVAVVAIGTIEASILVAVTLKELGIKKIIAKAISADHGKILERVGVTKVIFPERDMGSRLASSLLAPKIVDHINLSDTYSILEMVPPQSFIGKSLRDIDVRAKYGLNVIGIKKPASLKNKKKVEEDINVSPKADEIVREGDVLIIIGSNKNIEKMKERKETKDESRPSF